MADLKYSFVYIGTPGILEMYILSLFNNNT